MNGDSDEISEILQKKLKILMKLRGYNKVSEEDKKDGIKDIIVQVKKKRKKLLIRLITESRLSSGSIGVIRIRNMKKELEKSGLDGILLADGRYTFSAKREAQKKGIELISGQDIPAFDIFKHQLVPKHEILPKEEGDKLLQKFRIQPWQLPWIKPSDVVVIMIGASPGDILKITRKSPTAGEAITYRYVTSEGI